MTTDLSAVVSSLEGTLAASDVSWTELRERASQIVLFGSRASGDASQDSDWDLLIVSDSSHREVKIEGMDLIWVTTSQLTTKDWLGSELANHIAKYGMWLHGVDSWSQAVFVSDRSVEAKRAKIRKACKQLLRVYRLLETPFIDRRLKSIRRDLQRLMIMSRQGPVPPTPVLDREWVGTVNRVGYLSAALDEAEVEPKQPVLDLLYRVCKF